MFTNGCQDGETESYAQQHEESREMLDAHLQSLQDRRGLERHGPLSFAPLIHCVVLADLPGWIPPCPTPLPMKTRPVSLRAAAENCPVELFTHGSHCVPSLELCKGSESGLCFHFVEAEE